MAHRVALLLVASLAAPLAAADFIVTRYDDPAPGSCLANDCSLREAVIAANANSNADRILLSAGTYEMQIAGTGEDNAATGDLDLKQQVEVLGPGSTMTTIDANSFDRHFDIYAGGSGATIRGATLRGGSVNGSGTSVYVEGLAVGTLDQCTVRNNTGTGQVLLVYGQLFVRRSLVTQNTHQALTLASNASAYFENTTVADNAAPELQVNGNGGALTCNGCTLKNASSVLLLNGSGGGTATFSNSIVSGTCGIINFGSMISIGGNLESPGEDCDFGVFGDQVNVSAEDLDLGALDDHGGPTESFAPGAASFALEAGADGQCLDEDQRGVTRAVTGCDSGSTEASQPQPETPIFHDGFLQGNMGAWSTTVGS